eukprot:3565225-Prymnesium_polylepis.1
MTDGNGDEAAADAEGGGDSGDGLPQWVIDQTSGRSTLARVANLVEAAAGGDDSDDYEMPAPAPLPPDASSMPPANAPAWLQPGCCSEPGSMLLFLDVDGVLNKGIATYADPAALKVRGLPHALDV